MGKKRILVDGKMVEVGEPEDLGDSEDNPEPAPEPNPKESEDNPDPEDSNPKGDSDPGPEPSPDPDPEDMVVTIGDGDGEDDNPEPAPAWVKELRKKQRETAKENRRLKQELESKTKPATVQVGPKPTLESCDYDGEVFEQKLTAWYDTKRKADAQADRQKAEQQSAQEAWQSRLNQYEQDKVKLKAKVKGFDEAEEVVRDYLSEAQQGIIVQGAKDAALVVAAIGSNPDRVEELAAIKDPVKFAFAIAKLETSMTVKNRRQPPPPPEKRPTGSGSTSGAVDSTLDRLRKEAERTGDMTQVVAYKRKLKKSSRK